MLVVIPIGQVEAAAVCACHWGLRCGLLAYELDCRRSLAECRGAVSVVLLVVFTLLAVHLGTILFPLGLLLQFSL